MHEPLTAESGSRLAVFQMGEPTTNIEAALEFTESVDLALSRPQAAASLEQLHENTRAHSQRLILRSRTALTQPERKAVQNHLVVLQDHLRKLESLIEAGPAAPEVWHNTLKHYKVAGDDASPATEDMAAAELRLNEVMGHVRPKHRGLRAAQASGDPARVAACEEDLFATMPFVAEARKNLVPEGGGPSEGHLGYFGAVGDWAPDLGC